ncbi:MAG: nucleoside deaminase [Acidobacteria bacterium]|nr:nucleoside deaminase [Acidobacteriota bacterium]
MHNHFMARAIELAVTNARLARGGPFGAVIVKNGAIIAEAANSVTSNNDPTAHAEMLAIRNACQKLEQFELRGCELYASSEPCPMCLGAIYWARLERTYFGSTAAEASKAGFDDSLIYEEISQLQSERKIPMIQIMGEEAGEAFRVWEHQPNKVPY